MGFIPLGVSIGTQTILEYKYSNYPYIAKNKHKNRSLLHHNPWDINLLLWWGTGALKIIGIVSF